MLRKSLIAMLATVLIFVQFSCDQDEFKGLGEESQITRAPEDLSGNKRHRCSTDRCMHNLYDRHPGYKEGILQGRLQLHNQLKNKSRAIDDEILVVPVHVIIVHPTRDDVGSGANLSMVRITSQIEALNKDFRLLNSNKGFTPAQFSRADSRIQFCLAERKPDGTPTDGVTRYAYNRNFDRNEVQVKTATGWDPSRYLNIWVTETIDGLGYAYLPSVTELPDAETDGVAVLTSAFGGPNTGAEAPFDLGRTLTHEVGHYLGLDHIWGDGCGIDDGIADTPQQHEENYDCPANPSPSCGNQGDIFMIYMDYANDECLSAFTEGQAMYMRQILRSSRAALIQPGLTACAPAQGGEVEEEEEEEEVDDEEEEQEEPSEDLCLTLKIQPDDYANDIVWVVKDEEGKVLFKGTDYTDGDTELIVTELCLPEGCYRLIMRDRWGDGICCDYGDGWYALEDASGEEVIYSDGYYGSREVNWFCVGDASYRMRAPERDSRVARPRAEKVEGTDF